jgi:hypothetical protein
MEQREMEHQASYKTLQRKTSFKDVKKTHRRLEIQDSLETVSVLRDAGALDMQ